MQMLRSVEATAGIEPAQCRFCKPLRFHFATWPVVVTILWLNDALNVFAHLRIGKERDAGNGVEARLGFEE